MMSEKWTNVNDGLPRNGTPVIIGHEGTTFSETAFRIGSKWHWKGDEKLVAHWIKITHWMPLPDAPKEKN